MPRVYPPIVLVLVALIVAGGYAALTYPKTVATIPVSFKFGAESKTIEFDVSSLQDKYNVDVSVLSGNALWGAKLVSGNVTVWSHAASQGSQTSYQSGWLAISPGHYTFTFGTIGFGSLEGAVTLQTKGGFW
jgi:hypothetical protein